MGELPSPVKDDKFYLMAALQEVTDFTKFHLQVVLAYFKAEPHLLYFERLGVALALLHLLGAVVIILTPINDFCDRRLCLGRYFYKVQATFGSDLERFVARKYPKLLAVFFNYPQLRGPNGFIQARRFVDKLSP